MTTQETVVPSLTPNPNPSLNCANWAETVGLDPKVFHEVGKGIFVACVDLTPAICAAITDTSTKLGGHNRQLRSRLVNRLQASIDTGAWSMNGQTIVISNLWHCIEGHHRTNAGAKASGAFSALTVFGIDEAETDTIDTGVARSLADNMELAGVGRYGWLGATINLLITEERSGDPFARQNAGITVRERHTFIEAHKTEVEQARDTILEMGKSRKLPGLPFPEMCYAVYKARQANPDKAAAFVSGLISGAHNGDNDPHWLLREWFRETESKRLRTRKSPRKRETLTTILVAFKAFFEGTPLTRLAVGKNSKIPTL